MYYEFIQAHKRKIIAVVLVLTAALLIWTALILVGRIGKIATTLAVVPADATITIDGNKTNSGTQWLAAGKYEIIAQKDGFATQKKTINVTEKKKKNVAAMSLTPGMLGRSLKAD